MVSLIGIAAATTERVRRVVGVEATGINACPCAQGLVRGRAAERLAEAGYDDVERILDLVPLATHNQRGKGSLFVGTERQLDANDLVAIVEDSMSSPDLRAAEAARRAVRGRARAPAAALRRGLGAALARGRARRFPDLADADFLFSRQVNFETIHAHEVVAERYGTVGELRGELDGGEPTARHTSLADWLGAV